MFITFEGPEGSGKTTQLAWLADFLRQKDYPVLATREPGGTLIGDQIRSTLMNLENTAMHPRAEILLFQASRAQLVEEVIRPHLERGTIVLCDRYADATLAYQGFGYEWDMVELRRLVEFATGGLKPDLTLLLDVDIQTGLARRAKSGEWNRLDAFQQEFHQRVRRGYHQLAAEDPQRWVTIDASRSPEEVQASIREAVLARLV